MRQLQTPIFPQMSQMEPNGCIDPRIHDGNKISADNGVFTVSDYG